MCKEKEQTPSTQVKTFRREKRIFSITGWISSIFWIILILSIFLKLNFQMGICSCVARWFGYRLIPFAILNTEAILEVAKTIGVGSLFVAWIYAELGKSELGKPYVDLLKDFCKHYYFRTFSHIAAVLVCIWLSATGTIEGSYFALVIVIVGLVDQAVVLSRFIFNSNARKIIAIKQWKCTFNIFKASTEEDRGISLSDLYALEDVISVKDNYCGELCNCLAQAILNYIKNDSNSGTADRKEESIIIDISNIWENLLERCSDNERDVLIFKMISKFEICCSQRERILVCSGYLLWLCRHYAKKGKEHEESDGNVLLMILDDITQINHRVDPDSAIAECLDTLYMLLVWMHFLCNDITLCRELFESLMLPVSKYNAEDKNYCRGFALCIFDKKICDKYFDHVWKQIEKNF